MLTFTTGMVDAVSLLGPGRVFTANMTGNVVFLGFAVAGAGGFSLAATLTSLLAFVFGATAGSRYGRRSGGGAHGWLLSALTLEAGLVGAAALVSTFGLTPQSNLRLVVVGLLALAMGARIAAVRAVAADDLTTSILTMDLAGLASDSTAARGPGTIKERRVVAVLAMFGGAFLGAFLVLRVDYAFPLLLVAVLALVGRELARRGGASSGSSK